MKVSKSEYYAWRSRPISAREQADMDLLATIREIHTLSRGIYGSPRIHAELRLGRHLCCSRKRVERIMRNANIQGIFRRRRNRGCTTVDPKASFAPDLVERQFVVDRPNRLWVTDITQHPTSEGKLYCAVVLDAWSRRVIGWSIASHMRAELVCDALDMATWRRKPAAGKTIMHSDHGSQYTSWIFGKRIRDAGLIGSMGTIGDAYDNAVAESFFGTLQLELLDRKHWTTRTELANAIFEYIECFYNPERRHSTINQLAPAVYEAA